MKEIKTLRVNEIFNSIEGEGIRTGYPVTFIRLQGCNLNCTYCDTRYSCVGNEGQDMTVEKILRHLSKNAYRKITLTGGEPLMHKNVTELIMKLLFAGYEVNIETNGSQDVKPYTMYSDVIVTMDYKSSSSGMQDFMLRTNLIALRPQDVLKFVVGSVEDLAEMKHIVNNFNVKAQVFVSPVFGEIEPVEIVDYIKDNKLDNCRVQLQLHKFIYPVNMRGV